MRITRMYLVLFCAALWFSEGVEAQDTVPPDAGEVAKPAEDAAESGEDTETVESDPESYLDIEEDDFRPSEEIPADQSIDFPVDI